MFWQMVKGDRFKSGGTADALQCYEIFSWSPRSCMTKIFWK